MAAGGRIEPPVADAVAPRHRSAATAEAEPPDEPPGVSTAFDALDRHGLTTGPQAEVSLDEPMANSSMFSLPSITAPSRQRLELTVDSYCGTKLPRSLEPAVVRWPWGQNRSLRPSGAPSSTPPSPFARRAADARAMLS